MAGLTSQYLPAVRQAIERGLSNARVVSKGFSPVGMLYTPSAVTALRRSACDFAIQQIAGTESSRLAPCPSRLVLAYLPDPSDDRLVREFDFFCWPSPIDIEPDGVRNGTALEADVVRAVLQACQRGLARTTEWITCIYTGGEHPAQLPPRNFIRGAAETSLTDLFRRVIADDLTIDELRAEIPAKSFPARTFPKVSRPIRASEDARSRVYVPAAYAHGPVRALLEKDVGELPIVMNQIFRFGCPLTEGRHYDVQREKGVRFDKEPFTCAIEGDLLVTGPYVNIYPNDAIRVSAEATVSSAIKTKPPGR